MITEITSIIFLIIYQTFYIRLHLFPAPEMIACRCAQAYPSMHPMCMRSFTLKQ